MKRRCEPTRRGRLDRELESFLTEKHMDMNTALIDWWLARPRCVKTDAIHPMHAEAFEAGWSAAILAEREACARLMSDASLEAVAISHERFARYSAECADMIRMRSNATLPGAVGIRAE